MLKTAKKKVKQRGVFLYVLEWYQYFQVTNSVGFQELEAKEKEKVQKTGEVMLQKKGGRDAAIKKTKIRNEQKKKRFFQIHHLQLISFGLIGRHFGA